MLGRYISVEQTPDRAPGEFRSVASCGMSSTQPAAGKLMHAAGPLNELLSVISHWFALDAEPSVGVLDIVHAQFTAALEQITVIESHDTRSGVALLVALARIGELDVE